MKTKILPFAFTIALLIYCSSFLFAQNFQSDLIPLNLQVNPTNGQAGSGTSVSFYIYNQGSGIANASTTDIRISTSNSNVTTSDPLLASISVPSLPVDTTYPVTQSVLIPDSLSPGTYYVWVILDVNNTANQSNLTNDKAYASFTVNNSIPNLLDNLWITNIGINSVVVNDATNTIYIGGSFTFVGGIARNNIAHIKPDKTLDLSWNPNAMDGWVYALTVAGLTLYDGGNFTRNSGQLRNNIEDYYVVRFSSDSYTILKCERSKSYD